MNTDNPPDKRSKEIILDIPHGARSGNVHKDIKFTILTNAPYNVQHWALCPKMKQPIITSQT